MNYKNDKSFLESVERNDVFAIKSDLEGLIPLFKGDKFRCDEAVEYAINNSSFNWENDDGLYFGEDAKTIKEKYSYEKERLVQNFTKERYLKVLELYKEYVKEQEIGQKPTSDAQCIEKKEEMKKSTINDKEFKTKKSTIKENGSKIKKSNYNGEEFVLKTSKIKDEKDRKMGLEPQTKDKTLKKIVFGLILVAVMWVIIKKIF